MKKVTHKVTVTPKFGTYFAECSCGKLCKFVLRSYVKRGKPIYRGHPIRHYESAKDGLENHPAFVALCGVEYRVLHFFDLTDKKEKVGVRARKSRRYILNGFDTPEEAVEDFLSAKPEEQFVGFTTNTQDTVKQLTTTSRSGMIYYKEDEPWPQDTE